MESVQIKVLKAETTVTMLLEDCPSRFICPLTLEVMTDPVLSCHGHNFQREAIFDWLCHGNTTCPLTRKYLNINKLISDKNLQTQIRQWLRQQGLIEIKETEIDIDYGHFIKQMGCFAHSEKLELRNTPSTEFSAISRRPRIFRALSKRLRAIAMGGTTRAA
jgi:hypothetical protein